MFEYVADQLKKSNGGFITLSLHLAVLLLWMGMSCQYAPAAASADGKPQSETLRCAGMTYLVVSSSHAITVVNLTKDSMEVLVRKRNEKYLELTNRQFRK